MSPVSFQLCDTRSKERVFPCVLQMMTKLGVGESWRFVDVLGLDGDQLSAVPTPCCALMLLFPLTQQVSNNEVVTTSWNGSMEGGVSQWYRLSGVGWDWGAGRARRGEGAVRLGWWQGNESADAFRSILFYFFFLQVSMQSLIILSN